MKRRRTIHRWAPLACAAALSTLLGGGRADADPRRGSEAERLHHAGVRCMDVIERNACAITNFEALLEVETRERELVTDAMLRLIKLYRDEGRSDDVGGLLRLFWDVGMKHDAQGHVPWSTRFIPTELDMLMALNVEQMSGSAVIKALHPDARDSMLTCDKARRKTIESRQEIRRARRKASKDGRELWDVVQADREKQAERQSKRTESRASGDEGPIFSEAICPIMRTLGKTDLLAMRRLMGASNHHDSRRSVAIAEIPGLDALLAQAETSGRITRVATDHYTVPEVEYAGGPVHLLKLDSEELTMVPAGLVDGMLAARGKRGRRMNRELNGLVGKVPKDSGFFFVMTQAAMREMGFSGVKRSTRGFIEAMLPKPKGLQVAAMFGAELGLFTRLPTDTPGKGRMLVGLANVFLAKASEDDAEAERWLEGLDIAESNDRSAILASYLISPQRLEKLMME